MRSSLRRSGERKHKRKVMDQDAAGDVEEGELVLPDADERKDMRRYILNHSFYIFRFFDFGL